MKKYILITISALLLTLGATTTTQAAGEPCSSNAYCKSGETCDTNTQKCKGKLECTSNKECGSGYICNKNTCVDILKIIIPTQEDLEFSGEIDPKHAKELKNVEGLPEITSDALFTTLIKTILGWSMLLTIVAVVVAGIYYIQARGQEDDLEKAKDIILYLIIGMGIMAAAYGVVSGIIQFDFFKAK